MFSRSALFAAATLVVAACSTESTSASAVDPKLPASASASAAQSDLAWGPAPAVFPPGAEMAVLQGNPSQAEPFTVRLRMPNGYRIPPHTHPTAENVTVLSGTFLAAMGTQFDASAMKALGEDDFMSIPAESPHYAMARGLTVVQVHAIGPFTMTYVNPADAPAAR